MDKYLSVGDAIAAFLETHGLRDEYDMQRIIADWATLVGAPIAANTERLWVEDAVLFVKISSPTWKNELMHARARLKDLVNQKAGRILISEVKIV